MRVAFLIKIVMLVYKMNKNTDIGIEHYISSGIFGYCQVATEVTTSTLRLKAEMYYCYGLI